LEPGADSPLNSAVAARDRDTLAMVREAIAHKQTLLAYQPVMRASDPTNVAFYEGLIRVLDGTGRVSPARDFMAAVENTETGREIDVLALRMGLNALQDNPDLRLAINMAARSIGYKAWINLLRRTLNRDRTIGERLILEITEKSAMLVPELVIGFMNDLQAHGVCFALDDFGSGQTAIKHFRDFYFDILKIDGQFISGIARNPDNRVLTRALVAIADAFDMLTVAQFIESAEDADEVTRLGVDCLQGYHFGSPTVRPAWLQDRQARATG